MALLRKNVSQATVAAPTALKGKGKVIEAAEPASHRTNLSDVHVRDDEDSHSSSASPQGVLVTESKPWHTSEQLLQMLSSLQKQMEDQQAEMIQLRERAAVEKDAVAHI